MAAHAGEALTPAGASFPKNIIVTGYCCSNTQVNEASSSIISPNVSGAFRAGANIKAYVIHRETLVRSSPNITARRSAQVARSGQVSPRFLSAPSPAETSSSSTPPLTTSGCWTGAASLRPHLLLVQAPTFDLGLLLMLKTANAAGKDISLGFTIAKRITFPQSLSHNLAANPFHLYVAIGDRSRDGYSGLLTPSVYDLCL